MGVLDGAPLLRPSKEYTDTLKKIREAVNDEYPLNGDVQKDPMVAIDASIFIVPAMKHKQALAEFFMQPPVPVRHVATVVLSVLQLFQKHRFIPVLCCDGQKNPAKADETMRRYQSRPEDQQLLESFYRAPEEDRTLLKDVEELQPKAVYFRSDILYEVVSLARKEGFHVVGAPFEADSQLVSLIRQNIVDFVVTNDSDIPFQGAARTIMRLTRDGKCCLVASE